MSCHVLLIEDEKKVRRSIARVFEHHGYDVSTASRGDEALERMRVVADVDIIVLDLMMPEMTGWEVRERQLEEELLPEVPVVVLSGVETDLSEAEQEIEAVEYLVKPVRPSELCKVVDRVFAETRDERHES